MLTYGIMIVIIIWFMALAYLVMRKKKKDKIIKEAEAPEEPIPEEPAPEEESPRATEEEQEKAPETAEEEQEKVEEEAKSDE